MYSDRRFNSRPAGVERERAFLNKAPTLHHDRRVVEWQKKAPYRDDADAALFLKVKI